MDSPPGRQQPVRFRLEVDLLRSRSRAADLDGKPIHDLQISDLVLQDNGQPREIRHLWRDLDVPLTVGLVADVSLTQAAYIAQHRVTIVGFLHHVLQEPGSRKTCAACTSLRFSPSTEARDGSFRKLKVTSTRKDMRLRTRLCSAGWLTCHCCTETYDDRSKGFRRSSTETQQGMNRV
jgi:hypothetical protein